MTQEYAKQRLEQHGVRPTKQRLAVYEFLIRNPIHPTADTVFKELNAAGNEFSLATIYNSLNRLAEAGLVRVLTINTDEQRFDATTNEHGHFRCTSCGHVEDFVVNFNDANIHFPTDADIVKRELFCSGLCNACRL